MSEINFTTHLFSEFTDKYGNILQNYFLGEAIQGQYLSAGELYHYIYPEAKKENKEDNEEDNEDDVKTYRITPFQATFNKNCIWTVNLINNVLRNKISSKYTLDNFFKENLKEIKPAKNSEISYWEGLFVNAWIVSQNRNFGCARVHFDNNKNEIIQAAKKIIGTDEWYKISLWHNVLWSIEVFRLRLLLDDIVDDSFDFVYILDWIDIFEFRIVPKVLMRINEQWAKDNIEKDASKIYRYFIKEIEKVSEYPFAERYGLNKVQRRNIWNTRKLMLPLRGRISDVNVVEDKNSYPELVNILKDMIGGKLSATEVNKHIRNIIVERNKYRNCVQSNGIPYFSLCAVEQLEDNDVMFIESSLKVFVELTKEKNINDTENIKNIILIYYMLVSELEQQEQDDFPHSECKRQREELEQIYTIYYSNILSKIFERYTDNKELIMKINLADINDKLLADMLMIGSKLLENNMSDNVLEKIFQEKIDRMDNERNQFVNQARKFLGTEDTILYALFTSEIGKLERIRGYVDDNKLNKEEIAYICDIEENWKKEILKIHELFLFKE